MYEQVVNLDGLEEVVDLFGNLDENIQLLQDAFSVTIVSRGTGLKLTGDVENVLEAEQAVQGMIALLQRGESLDEQKVRYVIALVQEKKIFAWDQLPSDCICVTAKGRAVKAKTLKQKEYVSAVQNHTVTLCVGPAGTGKTYLAVALAVQAFRSGVVQRIVLTRPAVEAGEKLGFLPGDLQNKVDPYLRPLYDALFDMMGAEHFQRQLERGSIEVAPLAYMRGRTLDDSFIILDEAQNTTSEQMKMFLTRLGSDSKAVVTGDITQIDLPSHSRSGLVEALKVLKGLPDLASVHFSRRDVVRHRLVQEIIQAYEKYQQIKQKRGREDGKGKSID